MRTLNAAFLTFSLMLFGESIWRRWRSHRRGEILRWPYSTSLFSSLGYVCISAGAFVGNDWVRGALLATAFACLVVQRVLFKRERRTWPHAPHAPTAPARSSSIAADDRTSTASPLTASAASPDTR